MTKENLKLNEKKEFAKRNNKKERVKEGEKKITRRPYQRKNDKIEKNDKINTKEMLIYE